MILYCEMEFRLPMAHSLKDKRNRLKSLQEKLKNNFNIALAEIEYNDAWKKSVIGLVSISRDSQYLDKIINRIIDYIDEFDGITLVDYSTQYY